MTESQSKEARKSKAALLVYYSMDSSSFQKNCEQSVERSNLLLLKFTNLQLAKHFKYYTLFCFFDLYCFYTLSLSFALSHYLTLSLCSLCSVSLPHSVSLLFMFSCSFSFITSLCLSLVLVLLFILSHYLILSLSLSFAVSFDYLTRLSLSLIHCQIILSQRVAGLWLMSSPCLEYQGCHLIPFSYHLSCFSALVLLLFLSCHFLLMVHSPDFFPQNSDTFFIKS